MNHLKAFLLLPLIMGVIACSGGGTNSSSVERNADSGTDTPDDTGTPVDPVDPVDPVTVLLDGNLYFPVAEGVTWHYSNGDQVTFETGRTIRARSMVAMTHTSTSMPSEEYFQLTDDEIRYGGFVFPISIPSVADYEARVEFHTLRRLYNHATDAGQNTFPASKADLIELSTGEALPVDYDWESRVIAKSMVNAGQLGMVPAVEIALDIDYVVLLEGIVVVQRFPVISTTMWFSPGLGIVARQFGETRITLDRVDGIQTPVVFEFDQGDGLAQAPKQVLVDGNAVTDTAPTMVVAYGTAQTGWLDLEFDGTGSWRVSFTGAELPAGIHGAVVQITRDGNRVDVPVSVLVH